MKYLIWATNNNKFRTATSWVNNEAELFKGEKMLSFNSRDEADRLIKRGFKSCESYAITPQHPLFKHC